MKKLLFLIPAIVLFSCNEPEDADTSEVGEVREAAEGAGGTYRVDTTGSYVRFEGYGVGKSHPGRFTITDGRLNVDDGMVTGGEFRIRIGSMRMEQEGEMITGKLQPHLLSPDFFDVDKYPEAKFEITGVEPYVPGPGDTSVVQGANYRVSGNLELRDQKKNVAFPAMIEVNENQLSAKADFNIDRRDWNMTYGNDKSLGDKFISETVNIELNLIARED